MQWYAHQVYVSDDGRYLVRMGPWAAWLGELAVAFYENGRLLKAYVIAELFSDISDLSPPVSGYILLNLESSYDPSSNRLTIETTSNDIHTFDVTTGKIVSSKKIRSLEIDAEVLMRDGRQIPVTNFRHCGSYLGTKARLEDGVTEVQALIGYRDTEAFGGDSGVGEKVTFPLNQLSDLLNIGPVEGVDHQHILTFTSGERATVRLSDAFGSLCGDNETGEEIEFPLDSIEAVYFGE